jgi:hypothetical protein
MRGAGTREGDEVAREIDGRHAAAPDFPFYGIAPFEGGLEAGVHVEAPSVPRSGFGMGFIAV